MPTRRLTIRWPLCNWLATIWATCSVRRREFTPNKDKAAIGDNILGLRLLCLYGLKGAAAYMEHAHVLGQYDNDIYAQYHKIMAWLGTWPADMNALLECSMEIGQMNFKVMSILDAGETTKYGHPTPTRSTLKRPRASAS